MSKHNDLPYLEHIVQAITDIEESIKNLSMDEFISIKDVRDANIRRIEIIGEAVKNISKELRENNKHIEWNKIAGTRDKVMHKYFVVNLDVVWEIIKKDMPKLKKEVSEIIKKIN